MESSTRSQASPPHFGPALATTFLLRDYENYGLSERVKYHFHLSEVLGDSAAMLASSEVSEKDTDEPFAKTVEKTPPEQDTSTQETNERSEVIGNPASAATSSDISLSYGVARVLECIPSIHHHRLSRKDRLFLKTGLVQLNQSLEAVKHTCCEPTRLPVRLNASSRVSFAYETTRIVLVIDASPSMTSTFGISHRNASTDDFCCPMDRLPAMAGTLIHALAEKVTLPYRQGFWQPRLSFSVLAVYPSINHDSSGERTSLLVRDWTVSDGASAGALVTHLKNWIFRTVEEEIASRFVRRSSAPAMRLDSFSGTSSLAPTSVMDWWYAGRSALASLSSEGRPMMIVATDGRSVSTDRGIDDLADKDIPFFILDLSSPSTPQSSTDQRDNLNLIQEDPGADFPLYMSNDLEALYHISRTTGGCIWDSSLLEEASKTRVGEASPDSPLALDQYLGKLVRRQQPHMIRPNAVQWYTLFSLSPLTPTFYSNWGHLPPPVYLRHRWYLNTTSDSAGGRTEVANVAGHVLHSTSVSTSATSDYRRASHGPGSVADGPIKTLNDSRSPEHRKNLVRVTFSTYSLRHLRIVALLLMRVKEGYRAIRYGQSTHDPDKVSIMFHLPLELGTSLHYEVSYRSLSGHNHMVGFAHIKIELSGQAAFIQAVKTDFLKHNSSGQMRPLTLAHQVSAKLGRLLRSIRKEDLLQSYLSPLNWSDQLVKPDAPFVRRLGTLTTQQKVKHFRFDQFDCVCVGKMPYAQDTEFLNAFQDVGSGEEDLLEALASWATRRVKTDDNLDAWHYVRELRPGPDKLPAYCLVGIERSRVASRLFTVSVEIFEGSNSAPRRLAVLASLRETLSKLKDVRVLHKQMSPYLMGSRQHGMAEPDDRSDQFLSSQYRHESWDLVYDQELLPLLMRRRAELGGFWLLESSESYALFARLLSRDALDEVVWDDPGDMVQYQISILSDKVVVDLHMESESGAFQQRNDSVLTGGTQFSSLVSNLKKRDQECGLALRARTSLLNVFADDYEEEPSAESHYGSVNRLLAYAARVHEPLRAFHSSFVGANEVLLEEFRCLLERQSFGPRVAALSIDRAENIQESGAGLWFLVEYNKDTVGILQVSSSASEAVSEIDGCSNTSTTLTFFTLSISDLYSRREDFVGDDDSEQGTVEEYMCMTEFAEHLVREYEALYSWVAYRALLVEQSRPVSIHLDDLMEIMSPLEFTSVADVLVESGGEKLVQILSTTIQAIPGENFYFFYKISAQQSSEPGDSGSLLSLEETLDNEDFDGSQGSDDNDERHLVASKRDTGSPEVDDFKSLCAPLFVSFLLDGERASTEDLLKVQKSSKLTALLSIFRDPTNISTPILLPASHRLPASQIRNVLNAYVAEQNLERLRCHGRFIRSEDLRLARKCLRRAQDVFTTNVALLFYSSATDSIVTAEPAGSDNDSETGMELLEEELLQLGELKFKRSSDGSFIVLGQGGNVDLLPYWCFLDFGNGTVEIEIYHPLGPDEAREVLSSVHSLLMQQLHRVNQMLILRRLHKNRFATNLMIEEDDKGTESDAAENMNPTDESSAMGYFSCPVVFRKRFELYFRCATNPDQVARTVETSVLHIFSISNRRRVFVYKDESGGIFYMRLATSGGGLEPDGIIELVVHGINEPTQSLTKQLSRLLSKKILSISLDLLASVLMKNPRYTWRTADVNFVVEYSRMWKEVDDGFIEEDFGSQVWFYSFPSTVCDPNMVLLYFRQNICGSTFFHPFVATNSREESAEENQAPSFTFYYNNFPSKLSPKLQGRSTLTKKGAEFARSAGQGLAIIEVALVDSKGVPHTVLEPSQSWENTESVVDVLPSAIRTRTEEDFGVGQDMKGRLPNFFVSVTITDTALKRSVLHDWVHLTLDQVTGAWCIERQLAMQQQALLLNVPVEVPTISSNEDRKRAMIDKLLVGLPALMSMYESTNKLPHPAVQKVSFDGVIRSSTVASVALQLLEVVLDPIRRESKGMSHSDLFEHISVIRLSRSDTPRKVNLTWSRERRSCVVRAVSTEGSRDKGALVQDSHIDCPEYLICFASPDYLPGSSVDDFSFPKLFEEVAVGDEYRSELPLMQIKARMKKYFRRSFAFVLSVKRNRRFLLSYNWRADVIATVTNNLNDEEICLLRAAREATDQLQRRSLSILSPSVSAAPKGTKTAVVDRSRSSKPNTGGSGLTGDLAVAAKDTANKGARRAIRPVSIRRPKLVGKSVDGSAAHAFAASRARASFRGSYGNSPQVSAPKASSQALSPAPRAPLFPRRPRDGRLNDDTSRPMNHEAKALSKVVKEFRSKLNRAPYSRRLHTLQQEVLGFLFHCLWPLKPNSPPIPVAADFLLTQMMFDFVSTAKLLDFPIGMLDYFTTAFASFLSDQNPALRVIGVQKDDAKLPPAVFLGGRARKMKGLKCFPVLRVDILRDQRSNQSLLRCSGWTVVLGRTPARLIDQLYHGRCSIEMKASGPDKLTSVLRSSSTLEAMLVNFAGMYIEQAMRKTKALSGVEAMTLSLDILKRYDLDRQIEMLRSEYIVFQAPLILQSFRNPMIDHFTAPSLFAWLATNADTRDLLLCGPKCLLLPSEVEVSRAHAFCLLSDSDISGRLELTILCRAKGVDLHRFMFRQDSNVAVTIAKNIAIEAAGIALNELIAASTSLRLRTLWGLASNEATHPNQEVSPNALTELLGLCVVEPFQLLFDEGLEINWPEICDCMSLENSFSPSWSIESRRRLFYIGVCDMFLLVALPHENTSVQLDFVLTSAEAVAEGRKTRAAQLVANFILHCLWSNLTTGGCSA